MPGYIHHIEWCVSDLKGQVSSLVSHYGFQAVAQRVTKSAKQVMVKSGASVFILTQKCRNDVLNNKVQDDYPVLTCCQGREHTRDTVFNVCLSVGEHLDQIVAKIESLDGPDCIISRPKSIKDLKYAVARSCCGNVVHTLFNRDNNSEFLLPGFEPVTDESYGCPWGDNCLATTHVDHVTYVCHPGDSQRILQWYGEVFKMKRFLVNPQESIEGVVIEGDVNMRLTVGEWLSSWLCREEGVYFQDSSNDWLNFKLVLAEPFDNARDSHVQQYLNLHGGPGLQHIGLTTPNAAKTVQVMTSAGAQFRRPPPTYYQLASKVQEIFEAGADLDSFAKLGLLLDAEADINYDDNNKYLVQIFTKPVFKEDTFFLEVLERRGAKGFGAGNITALAQSIILYQQQLKQSQ